MSVQTLGKSACDWERSSPDQPNSVDAKGSYKIKKGSVSGSDNSSGEGLTQTSQKSALGTARNGTEQLRSALLTAKNMNTSMEVQNSFKSLAPSVKGVAN